MPKVRRNRSGTSRASPLISSESPTEKEIKRWDETYCMGCLDPPHNAIFIVCSSFESGCIPYMCGTSIRQSNCFVKFLKSSKEKRLSDIIVANLGEEVNNVSGRGLDELKLKCPLCRGDVLSCLVVEDARIHMNLKTRTCSVENCDYNGTFYEMRDHALLQHSEASSSKGHVSWSRREYERTSNDEGQIRSAIQAYFEERDQALDDGQIVLPSQVMPRLPLMSRNHVTRVQEETSPQIGMNSPAQSMRRAWRSRVEARRSTPPSRDDVTNQFWDTRSGATRNVREIIYISDDEEE